MNYEKDMEKAKKELINLFLKITITNKEEVYKTLFISFNFLNYIDRSIKKR